MLRLKLTHVSKMDPWKQSIHVSSIDQVLQENSVFSSRRVNIRSYYLDKLLILIEIIHYIDVMKTTVAPQITSLAVVYSIVYSDADARKHQSSASLAFVRGIHRDR